MWEEPCISGEKGSGTVFFSGCNLHCVYCQNYEISTARIGKTVSDERLAQIFLSLRDKGALNINLVTPDHYSDRLIPVIENARGKGLDIPIVYNTSGYVLHSQIERLRDSVDIYLTDFKYINPKTALKYSNAPDYPETAMAAIDEMVRQKGGCEFDENGIMTRGVIIRYLLLPGYCEEGKEIISYIHSHFGDSVYISIMNQYTPIRTFKQYPELNKRVSREEYDELVDFAVGIGVENGFIQEGETADESFIPSFDYEGL